jgi:hypothetical protein
MGKSTGSEDTTQPSRRNTLRAAAVGASLVWAAPLVQAVTMDSASAASAPPPQHHDNRDNEHRENPFDPGPKNKN